MLSEINSKLVNTLWHLQNIPAYKKFQQAALSVKDTQERYLRKLLRQNSQTDYGHSHGFDKIDSISTFKQKVPLTTYEDYIPYIDRIAQGEKNVLTSARVKLFEPSSGSTSARKLVPYTDLLQREYQHGIAPWITSLFGQFPQVKRGKTYWSISPAIDGKKNYGVIPVGFDTDASYLGICGKWFHSQIAVLPKGLSISTDVDSFKKQTLLALLSERNLRFISIWSPTFLILLCEYFIANKEAVLESLTKNNSYDGKKRAAQIKKMCNSDYRFNYIWPNLSVISCWTDGSSKEPARRLQSFFPHSTIQGKGLLATEAFVSFPFLSGMNPVLSVNSHFFEFLAPDGECLAAHQVKLGDTYSVVVTTGGGLYRYQIGDVVRITDFIGQAPTLEFVGKSDHISDRFGEKLHATHLAKIINILFEDFDFAMFAPDHNGKSWSYTLYIESNNYLSPDSLLQLQEKLCENPNYRQCIMTGQLSIARIFRINNSGYSTYTKRLSKKGIRIGDIKLTSLNTFDDWSDVFDGSYMNAVNDQ